MNGGTFDASAGSAQAGTPIVALSDRFLRRPPCSTASCPCDRPRKLSEPELRRRPKRAGVQVSACYAAPSEGRIPEWLRKADPLQSKVAIARLSLRKRGSFGARLGAALVCCAKRRPDSLRPKRTGVWGAKRLVRWDACGPPTQRGSEPGLVTCTAFKADDVRGLPG
jgi:hypothetical protein